MKKRNPPATYRLATVTATLQQLKEIGIDEDIVGMEVKVYEMNKHGGMYPPCSKIIVDNKLEWLAKRGINADYILPTSWLSFKENI